MSLHVLADHMASKGRGGDSMLVHMTPSEVHALQQLAEKHGKTLTINPETGQPEAFSLKSLLPMLAGAALNFFAPGLGAAVGGAFGVGAAAGTGIAVGGITSLATGSLSRGLMAGLGAYGGASLAGGLEAAGANSLADNAAGSAYGATSGMTDAAAQELGFASAEEAAQNAAAQAAKSFDPTAVSAADKMGAGFSAVTQSPSTAAEFAKANWKPLAAAAVPVLADGMVPTTTKMPTLDSGNIRKFSYDPYSQTYTPLGVFPAKDYKGFAGGGIVALAAGGPSDQAVKDWFASNAGATDAQIAQAMDQFKVSPEQVSRVTGVGLPQVQQRYEAAIAPQIVSGYTEGVAGPGGTTATPGSGYLGIYDDLTQRGITASELFNAPGYKGWSQPAISHAYDVASAINTFDPRTDTVRPSDKEWVTFMDANKFSVADIAQATGLSQAEVQRRYDAAKSVSPVILDAGTSTGVTGGTYGNGAEAPYGSGPATGIDYLGRTTSIATPGDKIYNPDDSVSVVPNIPGRPYGGFTGTDQVKSAYTAGGGSLGYTPYVPKTIDEFYAKYGNTGGSQQAYDFLMGKGAADVRKPVTPTGEIMRPYTESVMGMPANLSTKKYIFDQATRTYKLNPDYQPLSYDSTGKRIVGASTNQLNTAIGKGDAAVQALLDSGSVDYPALAAMLGITLAEAQKRFPKKEAEKSVAKAVLDTVSGGEGSFGVAGGEGGGGGEGEGEGEGEGVGDGSTIARGGYIDRSKVKRMALGGLGALAGGGQAQYNLGSYSDGGRLLKGPGDGVSDSIPATIGQGQPARLADGEFVVPARIVSELGNGSTEAGARKLYAMMDRVQKARGKTTGKGKVANNTNAAKYLPA